MWRTLPACTTSCKARMVSSIGVSQFHRWNWVQVDVVGARLSQEASMLAMMCSRNSHRSCRPHSGLDLCRGRRKRPSTASLVLESKVRAVSQVSP